MRTLDNLSNVALRNVVRQGQIAWRPAGRPDLVFRTLRAHECATAQTPAMADLHSGEHGHDQASPGEIAIGVIIGRTSEFFDFFVYAIASVLVFPRAGLPVRDR